MRYATPAASLSELEDRKQACLRRKRRRRLMRNALWTAIVSAAVVLFLESTGNDAYEVFGTLAFAWAVIYALIVIMGVGIKTAWTEMFGKGK